MTFNVNICLCQPVSKQQTEDDTARSMKLHVYAFSYAIQCEFSVKAIITCTFIGSNS